MSVADISDKHISIVLRYAFDKVWNDSIDRAETVRIVQEAANDIARCLDDSYYHRYPTEERGAFFPPKVDWSVPLLSPLAILKALQYVEYQLEEAPDFHTRPVAQFIRNHRFTATTKLEGYNDLPWSIE